MWSLHEFQLVLTATHMGSGEGVRRIAVPIAFGGSGIAHLLYMIKPAQPMTPQRSSCLPASLLTKSVVVSALPGTFLSSDGVC